MDLQPLFCHAKPCHSRKNHAPPRGDIAHQICPPERAAGKARGPSVLPSAAVAVPNSTAPCHSGPLHGCPRPAVPDLDSMNPAERAKALSAEISPCRGVACATDPKPTIPIKRCRAQLWPALSAFLREQQGRPVGPPCCRLQPCRNTPHRTRPNPALLGRESPCQGALGLTPCGGPAVHAVRFRRLQLLSAASMFSRCHCSGPRSMHDHRRKSRPGLKIPRYLSLRIVSRLMPRCFEACSVVTQDD